MLRAALAVAFLALASAVVYLLASQAHLSPMEDLEQRLLVEINRTRTLLRTVKAAFIESLETVLSEEISDRQNNITETTMVLLSQVKSDLVEALNGTSTRLDSVEGSLAGQLSDLSRLREAVSELITSLSTQNSVANAKFSNISEELSRVIASQESL